jgi:hypothetical protein
LAGQAKAKKEGDVPSLATLDVSGEKRWTVHPAVMEAPGWGEVQSFSGQCAADTNIIGPWKLKMAALDY